MDRIIKQNILVTGASGFIGRSLCVFLKGKGYYVRAAVRNRIQDISGVDDYVQVGDIDQKTDWQQALTGVDAVIHLAARVHIMDDKADNPVEAFRKVNVFGTENLARMAVKAGVKRFIFLSSVKVNGEGKTEPYREDDIAQPQDAYGISKLEAEYLLKKIEAETNFQTVIFRIPLVYGPGVKANFKNLIKIAGAGLPLPFKGINNRRSFLYIGNLINAIGLCLNHQNAAGEIFLLSDGQDVSTTELLKIIAGAMNKKIRLFYLHPNILKILCKITGKEQSLDKLIGSLFIDSGKIRNLLDWKAPFTLEQGIRETVKFYK